MTDEAKVKALFQEDSRHHGSLFISHTGYDILVCREDYPRVEFLLLRTIFMTELCVFSAHSHSKTS